MLFLNEDSLERYNHREINQTLYFKRYSISISYLIVSKRGIFYTQKWLYLKSTLILGLGFRFVILSK